MDNLLWEAFLEQPWQHLQQQLLALAVKPPTSKRTMGTGALISTINAEKSRFKKNAVPTGNSSSVAFRCSMVGGEKSPC